MIGIYLDTFKIFPLNVIELQFLGLINSIMMQTTKETSWVCSQASKYDSIVLIQL